jgi:hypothetical protein
MELDSTRGATSTVTLLIQPSTDRYDDTDERWLEQVSSLWTSLHHEVGGVHSAGTPSQGTKGVVETLSLIVQSASTLTAALNLLSGWLERDRSRGLTITWSSGDHHEDIVLRGDALGPAALHEVANVLLDRLGPGP